MKYSSPLLKPVSVITPFLAALALAAGCSSDGGGAATGGTTGSGGSGSVDHTGGSGPHGGSPSVDGKGGMGTIGSGGSSTIPNGGQGSGSTGGTGTIGSGGSGSVGGTGNGSGGRAGFGKGGSGSGGSGTIGAGGSGGKAGSAGGSSSGGGGSTSDACATTTVPTGGTTIMTSNKTGKAAGLDWSLWSNGSGGSITTFDVPAFSAAWNNSGDFLARLGLQWNATKTYDQYGTITAQFAYKKTGTGGGYSYIGMYGWSVSPCVEWYIVDDSYNKMPVNPGSTTNKGTVELDGGKYTLYTRPTTGTGGSKCSGTSSWTQFYSVRQTARQCGTISVSEHFKAWEAAGMALGKMDQAQILVEVGGGTGTIDFTVANVVASM